MTCERLPNIKNTDEARAGCVLSEKGYN